MIESLDHAVVLVRDFDAAVANYEAFLARKVAWKTSSDGAATALFTLANTSIELMAATGAGSTGDRVRAALDERGEGLASIAFRVGDIARMHRRLSRLGLNPEAVAETTSRNDLDGASLNWQRTRAETATTHGIRQFFLEMQGERPRSVETAPSAITGLDHIVIGTPAPERAAALYGARLGLDMALDRSNPDWGVRLMFFRCGDMIVEIAHSLKDGAGEGPDTFRGLSWRVADIDAAQARLTGSGFNVSEVRIGRKPGTRICTVRDRTSGVPTLLIQPAPPRN
ncbi:MAG: glyoxalase [Proteobacteria bacterium SG_bin9]|nr:MAG: glyoxalase [Proteobacteria bacterium SG_bin9]